ncbi:PleD family two-component system response regulator [Beijerinckia indica]|uniref:diguanylate cyclase n=1 Tax=Beijerinckia indica subsp. indica (strain ATCC 9039 / DSM 1715 / NCIMB 8712) TaxID=395963 RepID=B2IJ88_BEII9|nr:PleD family two-component system response regulator [Beijerinckia indica]ACB94855.1 response regulator receiver modulated diguanylate cyclase [Beijerinckia indica subsp. indica ATCC 9039]
MSARILVVDDNPLNLKLLEARLTAEYFTVTTATNGFDALAICEAGGCDIVLLDVMMPGLDGFNVCRHIKQSPNTMHISVVIVTSLDQTADRLAGLEAGADDFLNKPIDEIALIARVRSLARLHLVLDELRRRTQNLAAIGLADLDGLSRMSKGHVLLVEDRVSTIERVQAALEDLYPLEIVSDPGLVLSRGENNPPDLCIISLGLADYDGLRLCSQLRTGERTRNSMLLALVEREDRQRLLTALDLGVNDYLIRPFDNHELIARTRTQMLRKRYVDRLRNTVQVSMDMALIDPLTGLHNRRFLEAQLHRLQQEHGTASTVFSLMVLDIDHFKAINDRHGHDAGDQILKYFAARVKQVVRAGDWPCRIGGEEFVVLMPGAGLDFAKQIAERVRYAIEKDGFVLSGTRERIPVTVSIGLAEAVQQGSGAEPFEALFRRADRALYRAKKNGRNRVSADAA